jgi:polyisoprenoid-binding protein YceI
VIVALAIGGLVWFFSGDAPGEVDIDRTASSVSGNPTTTDAAGPAGVPAGIEGTWVVDTTVGEFTLEDTTTAFFAGFRIDEELRGIGATTAVGRTPLVSGSILIAGDRVTSATVSADLRGIVSNESRRNGAIQRSLGTATHPEATFELAEPVVLPAGAATGARVETSARGNLAVNGVTNEVVFDLQARMVDRRILVAGRTAISLGDFGVTAPSAPVVLSVADEAVVELQLWLSQG